MPPIALILCLLLPAAPALAQSGGDQSGAPSDPLGEARRLRSEASALRVAADKQQDTAKQECWHKFLVNACLDEAAKQWRTENGKANALDKQARDLERELKKREFAEREAQRLEAAPAREAAAAARAEKNREEMEEAQRRVERKQAEAAERR
jgi:hypothetical protein